MNSYDHDEIVAAIFVIFVLAVISGIFYNVLIDTFHLLFAYKHKLNMIESETFKNFREAAYSNIGSVKKHKHHAIIDFIAWLIIGICYVSIQFLLFDGVIRAYALIIFISTFLIIYKKTDKIIFGILRKTLGEICIVFQYVYLIVRSCFCNLTTMMNKRRIMRNHKE